MPSTSAYTRAPSALNTTDTSRRPPGSTRPVAGSTVNWPSASDPPGGAPLPPPLPAARAASDGTGSTSPCLNSAKSKANSPRLVISNVLGCAQRDAKAVRAARHYGVAQWGEGGEAQWGGTIG
eukprot:34690-Chlamydomonas_euryale.AAC.1